MSSRDDFIDYLWGDSRGKARYVRSLLKWGSAVALALLIHQGLSAILFGPSRDSWQALQSAVSSANEKLKANAKNGSPVASVCLFGTWNIDAQVICSDRTSNATSELGYIVLRDGKRRTLGGTLDPGRDFFVVEGVPSEVKIQASLETLLRDVERVELNPPDSPDVSLQLCTGTRDIADPNGCQVMSDIRAMLSERAASLDEQINRIRKRSLFFGPFHFLTLSVFIFAMIETRGLSLRWVSAKPWLYHEQDGRITSASLATLSTERLDLFAESRRQSIGDKMFYQAFLAGPRAKANVRPTEAGRADPSLNAPEALAPQVIMTLDSYRHHLMDDAISRQEHLETLGDTMLKLAFMGTVYGISTALFAARGLDTADPVEKLLAKAAMYSGIGVGFGTTLTGIVLSIVAAQFRSVLSGRWADQISRAYELIQNYGAAEFVVKSEFISATATSPAVKASDKTEIDLGIVIVWFLLLVAILVVLYLGASKWLGFPLGSS